MFVCLGFVFRFGFLLFVWFCSSDRVRSCVVLLDRFFLSVACLSVVCYVFVMCVLFVCFLSVVRLFCCCL